MQVLTQVWLSSGASTHLLLLLMDSFSPNYQLPGQAGRGISPSVGREEIIRERPTGRKLAISQTPGTGDGASWQLVPLEPPQVTLEPL